jgi:hypothetical protein
VLPLLSQCGSSAKSIFLNIFFFRDPTFFLRLNSPCPPTRCAIYPHCNVASFYSFMLQSLLLYHTPWPNRITMFPDQYSSMPYLSRAPAFTCTDPPRLFHRQPPSPPGGSPGTSSGQLADSTPPMKRDYDGAREYALLHPGDQSAGYPHSIHGVSEMGGGMDYNSLNLSFPSVRVISLLQTATYNIFLGIGHVHRPSPAIHANSPTHATRLPDWRVPGHGSTRRSIR